VGGAIKTLRKGRGGMYVPQTFLDTPSYDGGRTTAIELGYYMDKQGTANGLVCYIVMNKARAVKDTPIFLLGRFRPEHGDYTGKFTSVTS